MNDEQKRELERALAQLRHAYWLIQSGHVKDLEVFAKGLIHPQIATIERLISDGERPKGEPKNPKSFGNW